VFTKGLYFSQTLFTNLSKSVLVSTSPLPEIIHPRFGIKILIRQHDYYSFNNLGKGEVLTNTDSDRFVNNI